MYTYIKMVDSAKLNGGKKVLRHDIEFFLVLAGLAGVLVMLKSTNLEQTVSITVVGVLFAGYLTYSGRRLLKIFK